MIPKYLMFVVGLVAVATIAVAAMELAVSSQIQQDADATRGCAVGGKAFNASQMKCFTKPNQLQASEADESDDQEEDDE